MLERVHIEKSLTIQTKILGLEIVDLLIVGMILGLSFSVYHNPIVDLTISIAAYIGIFLFKLGKPMNYTSILLYYAMRHTPYRFYKNDIKSIYVVDGSVQKKPTQKQNSLTNRINIWAIEDDCIVSLNEEYTVGFEIESYNLFLLDDDQINPVLDSIKILLDGMKEHYTIQSIYSVDFEDYSAVDRFEESYRDKKLSEIDRLVLNSKISKLRQSPIRTVKIYLFVTIPKPGIFKTNLLNLDSTNNKHKSLTEKERFVMLDNVDAIESTIKSQLGNSNVGCEVTRMKNEDLINYVYHHLNPRRKNLIKYVDPIDDYTIREQLALSPAKPTWEYFEIDDVKYAGINLKLPPEYANVFELQTLLNLQFSYKFMMNNYVPKQETVINSLKRKLDSSIMKAQNAKNKNYEETQKIKEEDRILTEVTSSTQNLFKTSMTVIVGDRDEKVLTDKVDKIIVAFNKLSNAQAIRYNPDHERLFLSFLPGHGFLNMNTFVIKSNALKHWMLLWKNWSGTEHAQTLFKTVHNDLVRFDYNDPKVQAKNKLMSGTVGSGKSFAAISNIINFLITDSDNEVITIDVNPDYRYLSTVFDGKYIKIDPKTDTLSLFPKKKDFRGNSEGMKYDPLLMEFLRSIIELLVNEGNDRPLKNYEAAIIENCIKYAYDETEDEESFPILSNIQSQLGDYKGKDNEDTVAARSMSKSLGFWVTGSYRNLLNRRDGGINIDKRLVSFDLAALMQNQKLADVVFFVLNFMIVRKMYTKQSGRFLLNLDEFNSFANNEIAAKTIEYIFSAGRKFKADITAISQSPKHFLKHKAFDSILNNVHTKYYLNINEGLESLAAYGLGERERDLVGTLRSVPGFYSPMLFTYKSYREIDNAVILKIEPSPIEYWICTNNKDDYAIREKYKDLSVVDQLRRLAMEYPNGHVGAKR